MITQPSLDTKNTGGNVGQPEYAGTTTIISTKSADMTNSTTDLNGTYSSENLSAKWKNGTQDVPEKGRNQYEARS